MPTLHLTRFHILRARWRRIMALSGLWCLAAGGLAAQEIRGTLVEEPPGRLLRDAVVQLLAGEDSLAASALSSVSGRFSSPACPMVTGWLLRAPIAGIGRASSRRNRRDEDDTERFFGKVSIELHGYQERQSRVDWIGRQGEDPQWSRSADDSLSAVAVPFSRSPW